MTQDELLGTIIVNRFLEAQVKLGKHPRRLAFFIERVLMKVKNRADALIGDGLVEKPDWKKERALSVIKDVNAVLNKLGKQFIIPEIISTAVDAGMESVEQVDKITSFDYRIEGWKRTGLTSEYFSKMLNDVPVGGFLLEDWMKTIFSVTTRAELLEKFSVLRAEGKSYRDIVRDISDDNLSIKRHQLITLARTYIQTTNIEAQIQVYKNNSDIVKKVKWCSALEGGVWMTRAKKYVSTVCIRCAVLDGEEFEIEDRPACPLHPRCRCVLLPVLISWSKLRLHMPEIESVYRPYTVRAGSRVDTGGRKILYSGRFQGNFSEWIEGQPHEVLESVVGVKRAEIMRRKGIGLKELVKHGKVIKVEDL